MPYHKLLVSYAVPRLFRFPKLCDRVITINFNKPDTEAEIDEIRGILFSRHRRNCVILAITKLEN